MRKVDPKVDEAIQTLNMKDGPTRRKLLAGTGLVSATAAASALLSACTSSSSAAKSAAGNFPSTPKWQFWFDNHVTTNPFFTPTQYGLQDAAALLGIPTPKWGGSISSSVTEMVTYFNTAVASHPAGIATTVIDAHAFTAPIATAMNQGIPVVSYNADGTYVNGKPDIGSNRLAYVGQALYLSGQQLGYKIHEVLGTPSEIVIFIATPGTGNIQPRYDGAASVLTPLGYKLHEIGTGAATGVELGAQKAYLSGHLTTTKGAFAVDYGDTGFLAQALTATGLAGKIPAGGFDLAPTTLSGIKSGVVNFTINQQPYLQGFLPTLYLYMFNLSGGIVLPPDTDTGLTFVTKDTISQVLIPERFQGSSTAQKLISRSGAIVSPPATTST
jgi:simple sugar transport system substrate-binding protein